MGRQSKAIQARLKNLHKHVTTPQKAYVEDVTDEEDADYNHGAKQHGTADLLEEGFFFLDEDSDSDEDSEYGEEDIDEEELAELKTEDNIHRFNAILAEAQAVAIQAAKEAAEYLKSCLPNFFFFRNPTFGHSWRLLINLHKGAGSWCPLS